MKQTDIWEIIGDALIIALGILSIYIFVTIEVLGYYGVEANKWIRWIELVLGVPVVILGVRLLVWDFRR